jgi:hypothetical protein
MQAEFYTCTRRNRTIDGESLKLEKYYGKYRGTVINNKDLSFLGKIQAMVDGITDYDTTSWAMPCVPYAGKNVGFYFIPDIGSNVWIEFERGDLGSPIWSGCFWGLGETIGLDMLSPSPPPMGANIIKTHLASINLSDIPGEGITIQTISAPTVNKLVIDPLEITIKVSPIGEITVGKKEIKIKCGPGAKITIDPTKVSLGSPP